MGRPFRKHIPSSFHHVMLRGNNKQSIFLSHADLCRFCLFLQYGLERFDHRIHAFCLMGNHVHLAIQVQSDTISSVVQNLATRYAHYFNQEHERIGHLFQGRFKSVLVEGSLYLKELVRYIHLNPVRARLVNSPEEYKWSSHKTYLELENICWVYKTDVLHRFGPESNTAMEAYSRFILAGIGKQPEAKLEVGYRHGILGSEVFINNVVKRELIQESPEVSIEDLVDCACKKFGLEPTELRSPSRNRAASYVRGLIAIISRDFKDLSISELGSFFNRNPSGLQRTAERVLRQHSDTQSIKDDLESLRKLVATDLLGNQT